jgi:hypothetical protein
MNISFTPELGVKQRVSREYRLSYSLPAWYAYPGAEGVAVTDPIAAALEDVSSGADIDATIDELADTLRIQLNME